MSTHTLVSENHVNVLSIEEMTEEDSISLTDSAENDSKTIPQSLPLPQMTTMPPPVPSH
jgi:hypothetical protein